MTTERTLLIILSVGLLFSCSSNDGQQNAILSTSVDIKTLDTIIPFSGYWLCEDYFNSIRDFKSPKKAQNGSDFIVIPSRTLKQTIMIGNFHEGGPFLTILKDRDNYEIWAINDDSIITDKMCDIEIISPTKVKLYDKVFVKINIESEYLILEELLFKGLYTDTNGTTIEFKSNGQVVGLDSFNFYKPSIDYFDVAMQVDQVDLGQTDTNTETFGFKFISDSLFIYKLDYLEYDSVNNFYGTVDFGQLVYKLWRQE